MRSRVMVVGGGAKRSGRRASQARARLSTRKPGSGNSRSTIENEGEQSTRSHAFALSSLLSISVALSCVPVTAMAESTLLASDTFQGARYEVRMLAQSGYWQDLRAESERLGGHLATLGSDAEHLFVYELCRTASNDPNNWIGLTDENQEGHWAWVTGEPLIFTRWCSGQPSGDGDFAVIDTRTEAGGCWNDGPGNFTSEGSKFVVEYPAGSPSVFVPAAARVSGSGGSIWRTDLSVFNATSSPVALTLAFLPTGSDNSDPVRIGAGDIPALASRSFDDVVSSVFGLSSGTGGILVEAGSSDIQVMSRTYNLGENGTFGQGIPGRTSSEAVPPGGRARLIQLDETAAFRTNVGFLNVSSESAALVVADLYDEVGTLLGTLSHTIPPLGHLQDNGIFRTVTTRDIRNGRIDLSVSVTPVLVYASVVDNETQDPTYSEPRWTARTLSLVKVLTPVGSPYDITMLGTKVYLAAHEAGLEIFDVSIPEAAAEVGRFDSPDIGHGVAAVGQLAYLADYGSGLEVVDVSDPAHPALRGSCATNDRALGVDVSGGLAAVADGWAGLRLVDVSNPWAPHVVGGYSTGLSDSVRVKVKGSAAFVTDSTGLHVIDISSPTAPRELAHTSVAYGGVEIVGNLLYHAASGGLYIYDISSPSSPRQLGHYAAAELNDVAVSGNVAFVTTADIQPALQLIDVTSPASPALLTSYVLTEEVGYGATYVCASGRYAYVARNSAGSKALYVFEY
jgi:hypothetical protein